MSVKSRHDYIAVKNTVLKPCPACGGKANLIRLIKKYRTDTEEYFVQCKKCELHSEYAPSESSAVENWQNRKFSEIQLKLSKPLERMPDEAAEKLCSAMYKRLQMDYKNSLIRYNHLANTGGSSDRIVESIGALKEEESAIRFWIPSQADILIERMISKYLTDGREEK